ncbi:MAG TPA: gas vesicle protein K [Archangium sp.]|nr:gas vesicle protein K [Archangium sp.]
MNDPRAPPPRQLSLDEGKLKNGLGQLVLTLVKLLHELLEKQAVRRMEGGSLSDEEIERLGLALMRQSEEIERLRVEFGLTEEDLNLDLGPLGKLL